MKLYVESNAENILTGGRLFDLGFKKDETALLSQSAHKRKLISSLRKGKGTSHEVINIRIKKACCVHAIGVVRSCEGLRETEDDGAHSCCKNLAENAPAALQSHAHCRVDHGELDDLVGVGVADAYEH